VRSIERRATGCAASPTDARQRQLVSSAAALFDEAGHHTTNMSELARAGGIEKRRSALLRDMLGLMDTHRGQLCAR
jgi:hypothetical protein